MSIKARVEYFVVDAETNTPMWLYCNARAQRKDAHVSVSRPLTRPEVQYSSVSRPLCTSRGQRGSQMSVHGNERELELVLIVVLLE